MRTDRHHPLLRAATLGAAAAWMVGGLALVALLLPGFIRPDGATALTAVGCAALATGLGRATFAFRVDDQQFDVRPDAGVLVFAALVLAPPLAALVGALAAVEASVRRPRVVERCFGVIDGGLVTGVAALLGHAVASTLPGPGGIALAALGAAGAHAALRLFGAVLFAETRRPGGGTRLLLGTPTSSILLVQTSLAVASVAVAAPWIDRPVAALVVVAACQLATWRLLAILHNDHATSADHDVLLATFERYVPRHVASGVLEHRRSDAAASHPGLTAARRELTVLFADVRGFTSWSEQHDAAEVLGELTDLLDGLAESILATGGTIDKFTGDGLMAFWNAPVDQPDHAARAVRSLPPMLMRLHELNLRREAQRSARLEIGVGIATGHAMVGEIGHHDRVAYSAIGDAVNLAARLEKGTREHDLPCLVDESTFLALPHAMQRQFTRIGSHEVRGRVQRARIYAPSALVRRRDAGAAEPSPAAA